MKSAKFTYCRNFRMYSTYINLSAGVEISNFTDYANNIILALEEYLSFSLPLSHKHVL